MNQTIMANIRSSQEMHDERGRLRWLCEEMKKLILELAGDRTLLPGRADLATLRLAQLEDSQRTVAGLRRELAREDNRVAGHLVSTHMRTKRLLQQALVQFPMDGPWQREARSILRWHEKFGIRKDPSPRCPEDDTV